MGDTWHDVWPHLLEGDGAEEGALGLLKASALDEGAGEVAHRHAHLEVPLPKSRPLHLISPLVLLDRLGAAAALEERRAPIGERERHLWMPRAQRRLLDRQSLCVQLVRLGEPPL